jgi:hypothetical protein
VVQILRWDGIDAQEDRDAVVRLLQNIMGVWE